MAVPPAIPPGPAPAAPTRPVPAGRMTTQTSWVWWLIAGGFTLVILAILIFRATERINDGIPPVPAPAKGPPSTPAVAELERATVIIAAADVHRKALGCDTCDTRVETAKREVELAHLRKRVGELEAEEKVATKSDKPAPKPEPATAKVDIVVRQIPPPPPPSRPCEPVDPCYRRSQ